MKNNLEDIKFLLKKLEETHPCLYFDTTKENVEKYVKGNFCEKDLNDLQFYYHLQRLFKIINDPHTKCRFKAKKFPLKLKVVDGKVLVIAAAKEHQNVLNSEITAINDIPVDVVLKELEKIISYTAIGHLESEQEHELLRGSSILSLPIFKNSNNIVKYTFEENGKTEEIEFNWEEEYKKEYNYDFLEERSYWFEYGKEKNIVIIKYKSCYEDKNKPMEEFVNDIKDFVQKNSVDNIIVDIRGNRGGDSSVIHPLLMFLRDYKAELITLIDKDVYSSGRWALFDLKRIGSKFVGTEIGTAINCFGNNDSFELPNSKININCSTTYWYYESGIMNGVNKEKFQEFYNNFNNKKYFTDETFTPEIYVKNNLNDYKNNYDKELNKAIECFNQRIQ